MADAIAPPDTAMATPGRLAAVHSIDATPWLLTSPRQWLWGMASDTMAFSLLPPQRSHEACATLRDAWAGLLVSEGYGVSQRWGQARQTGLAHRVRRAGRLGTIPPSWPVGRGHERTCSSEGIGPRLPLRAGSARLCKLIAQSQDRTDAAGRFARRLRRAMDTLWVWLAQQGVEPTTNRAEHA